MINERHLKLAIEAISGRDPETGLSLKKMLARGDILALPPSQGQTGEGDFWFIFDGRKTRVRKFIFFNEGIAPIEQQLLLLYGEYVKKWELARRGESLPSEQEVLEIREAGLRTLVNHEIDHALERFRDEEGLVSFLDSIQRGSPSLEIPRDATNASVLYEGVVDRDIPALFQPFPFCRDALMQVAGMNLEYFHVRFLLNCLADGGARNLYSCVVKGRIEGLIYLAFRETLLSRGMEIKYMATRYGMAGDPTGTEPPPVKGVGTLLVAGAWLLWKSGLEDVNEIFLDSEAGAVPFYESVGFRHRRRGEYKLQELSGRLPEAVLIMTNNCPEADPGVIREIADLVKRQVKKLGKGRKNGTDPEGPPARLNARSFLRTCLSSDVHPVLREEAVRTLLRYKENLSGSDDLIRFAAARNLPLAAARPASDIRPVAVVQNGMFTRHLENIFHLENGKRVKAIRSVLQDPSLEGRWFEVEPRVATPEELSWVHTREHINRIAATAGQRLASFDMDTQTTPMSWDVARLAVGSVFSMLDAVWRGKATRGFAGVRPPGHHAEPDRAMGFCLFNNIALGARYLQKQHAVRKVMIVDLDVHHGNGTQAAFYDTSEVLFLSAHQVPSFPGGGGLGEVGRGRGEGFTVNIPMEKGYGDREYAGIITALVDPLAREFEPEIILVSCGFDLYQHDRLGGMTCTPEGYALMTHLLVETADRVCDGRIAFVMEGGYSIKGIRECSLRLLQELSGVPTLKKGKIDRVRKRGIPRLSSLRKVIEIHRKYWSLNPQGKFRK